MNLSSAPALPEPWPEKLSSVAAFAVPGLALWMSSGYSYGAVLLLIGALCTLNRWPRELRSAQPATWWFAFSLMCMALIWALQADPAEHFGRADRSAKFVLGAVCLFYVTVFPPRAKALLMGLVVGSLGAGSIALWEVFVRGADRASGTTNAIQYGNIALCMAVMVALYGGALWSRLGFWSRALGLVAVVAGLNASVLSQSRGGWLALLLVLPLGLVWLRMHRPEMFRVVGLAMLGVVAIVVVLNVGSITQRFDVMEHEIHKFDQRGDAESSVGQRLEHWRFAWNAIQEKPLLGWGFEGYMQEKARRVAAGDYGPSIAEYKFVHNEFLDQWVKLGVLGPLVLLLFYAVPLAMFLPLKRRMRNYARDDALGAHALALRLCGCCVPLLYIGFGLTQVFFAHNSGIMFYVFMVMLIWAALCRVEAQLGALASRDPL